MDNLTHTLIGVLVGEAAAAHSKRSEPGLSARDKRNLYVTMMAVGSNLPDLDFLYSTVTGSKLDYLLHHRGHTHTFVVAILIAALLAFACELWMRKRKLQPSRADRFGIIAVALLAPVMHIFMDMTNNYGVHPWWPFDNRWTYGDSVFIIEPLLWTAAAPLAFTLQTRVARVIVALILAIGVGLTFFTGMVPLPLAIAYMTLTALLLVCAWRYSPQYSIGCGVGLWLVVTFGFIAISHFAGRRVEAIAARAFPSAHVLDHVLTPMPVNPICWEIILVQQEGESLVLRRGMMSMRPAWIAAGGCPGRGLDLAITAPLQPVGAANDDVLQWYGEVHSPLRHLQELWRENCRVDAFMRFARAPWLSRIVDRWVLGDLRYDREAELGFAELEIESDAERCPKVLPPWVPPREELRAAPGRDSPLTNP